MKKIKFLSIFILIIIFYLTVFPTNISHESYEYFEYNNYYHNGKGPLEIRIIKIKPCPGAIEIGLVKDVNLQKPSKLIKKVNGTGCINANYFDPNSGRILGIYGENNKIISEAMIKIPARPAFILDSRGNPEIRKIGPNGEDIPDRFKIIVGGGPTLIKDGEVFKKYSSEKFSNIRNPLTAVGIDLDKNIYFITVDGRSKRSIGLKYNELASFLADNFNITDAMCFDGGGSTTMILEDPNTNNYDPEIKNTPSDKRERAVASIIYFKIRKLSLKIGFVVNSVPKSFYNRFKRNYESIYLENRISIGQSYLDSLHNSKGKKVIILSLSRENLDRLDSFRYRDDLSFLVFLDSSKRTPETNYLFHTKTNKFFKVNKCSYDSNFSIGGSVVLRWRNVVDQNPPALVKQGNIYLFNGNPTLTTGNEEFVFFLINFIIDELKEVA